MSILLNNLDKWGSFLLRLEKFFDPLQKVAVAFSGGVDSTFLLAFAASILPRNTLGVTAKTPLQTDEEIKHARMLAKTLGVSHLIVPFSPLNDRNFTQNNPKRCYFCKKGLFSVLKKSAQEEGYLILLDGTNADDMQDYRPGKKALEELGIKSPLQESGIGKECIREMSRKWNLPTWDLPSNACLASRIAYHTQITGNLLKRIEKGEKILKGYGLSRVRLRVHRNLASIEVAPSDFPTLLSENIRESLFSQIGNLGFSFVTLDLEGLVSGKMNRDIF